MARGNWKISKPTPTPEPAPVPVEIPIAFGSVVPTPAPAPTRKAPSGVEMIAPPHVVSLSIGGDEGQRFQIVNGGVVIPAHLVRLAIRQGLRPKG